MPSIFRSLFGMSQNQKPLPEVVHNSKQAIGEDIKGLEEELAKLKQEEAKVLGDLRTAAANGDQTSMRVLAKSLLGLRNAMAKLQSNVAHMQSLSATLTVVESNQRMTKCLEKTTETLRVIQDQVKPEKLNATMEKYKERKQRLDIISDAINHTLEDVLDDGGMEESTERVVNQMVDALNMELATELGAAPRNPARLPAAPAAAAAAAAAGPSTPPPSDGIDEVIARMSQLRSSV